MCNVQYELVDEPVSITNVVDLPQQAQVRLLDFMRSNACNKLFSEGMGLVEEVADFLGSDRHKACLQIQTQTSLVYASKVMTLTLQLLKVASWLLLSRGLAKGEMTVIQACQVSYRLVARDKDQDIPYFLEVAQNATDLPDHLLSLMVRVDVFYERLVCLDRTLYISAQAQSGQMVSDHMYRLKTAFDG